MKLIDQILKIGLLMVACGFLAVYAYSRKQTAPPASNRYVLSVGNLGTTHTVYMLDTQDGQVYYAEKLLTHDLQWRGSNPKEEAKK